MPVSTTPRKRRWFRRLLIASAVIAVLYLARPWLLPPLARFLDVSETPRPVDYVMVLGGGAETRPFVAAALINAGLARKALIPMTRADATTEELFAPEHEVTGAVLMKRGVPGEDVIVLPGEVASTHDEAGALARFLDAHGPAAVAVVTTNYHTRRAEWIFRRTLGGRATDLYFVAAPTEEFNVNNWWQSEAGLIAYSLEYLKLGYYFASY